MFDFRETGGLFDHFEVNREPFWPRISWLIAGSGAWHLVLLACIILVPPVRNAFNLAVMFSGGGFVDRPYNKTDIGDEGDIYEITTEKFHYPEGYFLMDQQGMPIQQFRRPLLSHRRFFRRLSSQSRRQLRHLFLLQTRRRQLRRNPLPLVRR